MKPFKHLFAIVISALSFNAIAAVDGFQELKFGMSLNDIKQIRKCEWAKFKHIANSWECKKFEFFGEKTRALVTFNEGKFVKIQIVVPEVLVEDISKAIPDKYPISSEMAVEETKKKGDIQFTIKYEENTVSLITTLIGGNENNTRTLLTYTDKNYLNVQTEELKEKKNKIKEGL